MLVGVFYRFLGAESCSTLHLIIIIKDAKEVKDVIGVKHLKATVTFNFYLENLENLQNLENHNDTSYIFPRSIDVSIRRIRKRSIPHDR